MKRLVLALVALAILACAVKILPIPIPDGTVLYAQTLPYVTTYTWDAPVDGSATGYRCYLDGVPVATVTGLSCSFPIAVAGPHVLGVASTNPIYLPGESTLLTLAVTLKAPSPPTNGRAK